MPIDYQVSRDGLRIDTFPSGILDIEETIDYFNRLQCDTRIQRGAIEIVYFKQVTDFRISSMESEKITQVYQAPKTSQLIAATIFVCESDLAYGIGRMLQTYHEISNPLHKVLLARSDSDLNRMMQAQ